MAVQTDSLRGGGEPAAVKCGLCRASLGFEGDAGLDDLAAAHVCAKRPGRRRMAADLALMAFAVGVLALGAASFVGGYSLNTVTSGSMRPGVQPGDLVILQRVPSTALKVGDVIAYVPPKGGEPLLHRIAMLRADGGAVVVQTQGDANNAPDFGPVQLDASAYRMVGSLPLVGWLIELRALVWLAFVAAVLATILLWLKGVVRPTHPVSAS